MIAEIDMMHFAGHAPRQVGEQIERAVADFLDRDGAAHRRVVFVPLQNVAEIADAGGRQRLDRPCRDGVDADILLAEIGGEITHARLECRLGDAHDVIMRHPFLGAVIGQRQDRAAVGQQLLGALGNRGQRKAGDQHGLGEVVRGRFEVAAVELVLVRKSDGVHEEVDFAPLLLQHIENGVDRRGIGDVAMPRTRPPSSAASGSTRFLSASPCQVSAISAPAAWQALAMPQAIDRLFATPKISPRLPFISPEFFTM